MLKIFRPRPGINRNSSSLLERRKKQAILFYPPRRAADGFFSFPPIFFRQKVGKNLRFFSFPIPFYSK